MAETSPRAPRPPRATAPAPEGSPLDPPPPGSIRAPVGQLGPDPWRLAPETRRVMAALLVDDGAARFVGGCVRDSLAHRLPPDGFPDIDIATTHPPDRVMALAEAAGLKAVPTGLAHGTVTLVCEGRPYEVTTLRRDTACDGRHAEVAFTSSFEEDARRRDFSINALSADLDGRVYDPFDGIADLTAGRVRFIGRPMDRIREDALRILRFFRFFARFGHPPANADALSACATLAPMLDDLSAERIRQEMLAILAAPDPGGVLALMRGARVLPRILPEAGDLATLRPLELLETRGLALEALAPDPLRRLAALLGAGDPDHLPGATPGPALTAAALAERLRLSKAETRRLAGLLEAPPAHWPTPDDGLPALRRRLDAEGVAPVTDRLLLRWAVERTHCLRPRPDRTDAWRGLVEAALDWRPPRFPVTGRDLTHRGITGPAVGHLLSRLRADWAAEGAVADRAALLERLDALIAEQPPQAPERLPECRS